MEYGEARVAALQRKRQLLEGDILKEQGFAEPDNPKLCALKSKRLKVIDQIGRLQTQKNLMDQLTKMHRVISKKIPGAPHESLLVLDATTGQNGISQARNFSEATECTGIILAKLDGSAKGGVVVPIRQQMGIPVKYVGVGEQIDDLEVFDPDRFVDVLVAN